jgi:lipopolysaccharide biosynthesis protein
MKKKKAELNRMIGKEWESEQLCSRKEQDDNRVSMKLRRGISYLTQKVGNVGVDIFPNQQRMRNNGAKTFLNQRGNCETSARRFHQ